MLKDNLIMLRRIHGFSQEDIADKIGISRQAYAKWEKGLTIPDVEKCSLLAGVYDTTVDGLLNTNNEDGIGMIPTPPKGKNIWGAVTVNNRGQIVIPKGVRNKFGLDGGQRLIVLSDEMGMALIPAEQFEEQMKNALKLMDTGAENEK
jgi:AbrB family looped-hinge helix DNA binding protein